MIGTHIEQVLNVRVGLVLDFVFVCLFRPRFSILRVFVLA